ncbi:M50 family metallopeptidase [Paractinoplanes lichenicola]|uniref:M50 family metallopeptidase n=1 Tax=Paractinoplanes lichenicola TaxID=2802976 RepID=A0ABS1VJK3_9ACTN|nr:M50 family metallopeptidase [Actinoplanes lichenicola]MBL7254839.1 M50 family metallopeptidase [Actinoplanes lichenicola]
MDAPPGLAWSTAVVGFVLAMPLFKITHHAITLAHEGGHALIGLIFGGKLLKKKVHLTSDGGGATHIEIGGLGRVFMLLAGYLGPSVVGLSGALMLVHGFEPSAVIMLSLVFGIFVLVLTRNAFGLLVAAGTVGLLWVLVSRATDQVQLVFAYVWVWFMLMGSTRMIPRVFWGVRQQKGVQDPELLEKHTHIGDVVWLFLFWIGTLGALVYGGAMMLRHTGAA